MVAFRKVLPVLALVVMMAAVASAQNATFQCAANAGVPPLIRSEGLAEPVGDLTLNCTGGTNTNPLFVNVQIFLSTNVTSNVLGSNVEALLMIDDPIPAAQCLGASPNTPPNQMGSSPSTECTANMWLGQSVSGSPGSVIWKGIPIVPPGSVGTRIIRISNVRANATGVPSGSYVPGTITEYISITGSTSVPVANQPQTIAFVQDSLSVSISGTTGKQCTGPTSSASIKFTELFPSAFRKKIENGDGEVEQSTPGLNYVTESMFTNEAGVPGLGKAGKANQGTRFIVKFKNVQNGVGVNVPNAVKSGTLYAVLVAGAASDGSGSASVGIWPPDTSGTSSVSLTSGAGFVVYEVMGVGAGVNGLVEDQAFSITIGYSWTPNIGSNVPGLGTSQVAGGYGPISATITMSATAPEPRFKEKFTEGDMLTISACRTILLFPYITNQIGFDTGIVVANTSSDPLSGNSARQQQGACTLYYYGGTTGGGAAPAAQTTQVIPTGMQLVFTLSGGGTYGAPGAPGFQGYMFAICDFQFAHGYAFVTKMGAVDIAHGYLALVVPDRSRIAQHSSYQADANQGEQLGY
jgi:hypothetical protein